jgi:hypothetical protein
MYTLEQLQNKSLKELKEIGWELNVLPEGDRRYRENWIEAIAGINPPLLQLLEVSPAEVQAQESPIIETVEASPAALECPSCGAVHGLYTDEDYLDRPVIRCLHCSYCRPKNYLGPIRLEAQEPIAQVAKTSPGVEVDRAQEPISQVAKTSPGADSPPIRKLARLPEYRLGYKGLIRTLPLVQLKKIAGERNIFLDSERREEWVEAVIGWIESGDYGPRVVDSEGFELGFLPPSVDEYLKTFTAADNPPGVEVDSVEEPLPECSYCFDDGYLEDESGLIKSCVCSVEPKLSCQKAQSAIALWDAQNDEASPVHLEPPDPDEFDSMFAFWAAYDAWDKATDDREPISQDKPLEISLDSFCEWAPCPLEWYEPSKVLEVSELSIGKSSSTSDFFIPTFAEGDRSNGSDEPPDTGTLARLRGPKPPKFPPQGSQPKSAPIGNKLDVTWTQLGHNLDASQSKSAQVRLSQSGIPTLSRNYPETIPKLSHRVVAGSTQPARSPPGGDA